MDRFDGEQNCFLSNLHGRRTYASISIACMGGGGVCL